MERQPWRTGDSDAGGHPVIWALGQPEDFLNGCYLTVPPRVARAGTVTASGRILEWMLHWHVDDAA
jgi:hypothetical protein